MHDMKGSPAILFCDEIAYIIAENVRSHDDGERQEKAEIPLARKGAGGQKDARRRYGQHQGGEKEDEKERPVLVQEER